MEIKRAICILHQVVPVAFSLMPNQQNITGIILGAEYVVFIRYEDINLWHNLHSFLLAVLFNTGVNPNISRFSRVCSRM